MQPRPSKKRKEQEGNLARLSPSKKLRTQQDSKEQKGKLTEAEEKLLKEKEEKEEGKLLHHLPRNPNPFFPALEPTDLAQFEALEEKLESSSEQELEEYLENFGRHLDQEAKKNDAKVPLKKDNKTCMVTSNFFSTVIPSISAIDYLKRLALFSQMEYDVCLMTQQEFKREKKATLVRLDDGNFIFWGCKKEWEETRINKSDLKDLIPEQNFFPASKNRIIKINARGKFKTIMHNHTVDLSYKHFVKLLPYMYYYLSTFLERTWITNLQTNTPERNYLCSFNLHRLLLISFIIAGKAYLDIYPGNKYLGSKGGVNDVKQVNNLEAEFLFSINFDVNVPFQTYQKIAAQQMLLFAPPPALPVLPVSQSVDTPLDTPRSDRNLQ